MAAEVANNDLKLNQAFLILIGAPWTNPTSHRSSSMMICDWLRPNSSRAWLAERNASASTAVIVHARAALSQRARGQAWRRMSTRWGSQANRITGIGLILPGGALDVKFRPPSGNECSKSECKRDCVCLPPVASRPSGKASFASMIDLMFLICLRISRCIAE